MINEQKYSPHAGILKLATKEGDIFVAANDVIAMSMATADNNPENKYALVILTDGTNLYVPVKDDKEFFLLLRVWSVERTYK